MKNLFLSYSSKDRALALSLKASLESCGHQVWFDQEKIAGGEHYAARIPKGLNDAELFLVLCTKNSMGDARVNYTGSSEVIKEIELALQFGCRVLPLKADDTPNTAFDSAYQYHMSTLQWIDICAAVAQNDFTAVIAQILADSNTMPRESLDAQYLKQATGALKTANPEAALAILEHHHFQADSRDEAKYLLLMARLQMRTFKRLSKSQADTFVTSFTHLLYTDMASAAAYSLGALSRHYYQENYIADATPGFNQLKAIGQSKGRVKAKYKKTVEPILPAGNRFSLDWDF